MSILARVRTTLERRRGVLAAQEPEEERFVTRPAETAGTRRLERPESTPSMRVPEFGATAGTARHRTPHGTPSTERLHNPRHGA